jgi:citrate synthase
MKLLKQKLMEKIPQWQDEAQNLLRNSGDKKISDVTVSQAYGGMRGVKVFVCDTSSVSAETGLIIRDHPLLDITHILPEEVFYLLITGELPRKDELTDLQNQFSEKSAVPDYIWDVMYKMPADSHPMSMFNTAIMVMQRDSVFRRKYDEGVAKDTYWEYCLEDGINLLAKLPGLAAGIYRIHFNKGALIDYNPEFDWSGNFVHMTGIDDPNGEFKKLMQLYFMLHCDHEGGNVSAFAAHTVASALSDPYYSVAAGLNGLAGPLHGLANQECLKFVLEIYNHFNSSPSKEELKQFCWDRLNNGRVIPGYGHAVLRCPDPRFVAFLDFGKKHIKNDDIFDIVKNLYDVVPPVLQEQGKAKNPWPNVDAASGSLLYYYGLKEFKFYTVLFSVSRTMGMIAQMVINRALGIPITRPKSVTTDWLKNNT